MSTTVVHVYAPLTAAKKDIKFLIVSFEKAEMFPATYYAQLGGTLVRKYIYDCLRTLILNKN